MNDTEWIIEMVRISEEEAKKKNINSDRREIIAEYIEQITDVCEKLAFVFMSAEQRQEIHRKEGKG